MNSANQTQTNDPNVQKYIQQAERKKAYNRAYYQSTIKPKRETNKQEVEHLKEKCEQLEAHIYKLQNEETKYSTLMEDLRRSNQNLINENSDLKQQIIKLHHDQGTLRQSLEIARQRNYELMMEKADQLLPNVSNLTLNS